MNVMRERAYLIEIVESVARLARDEMDGANNTSSIVTYLFKYFSYSVKTSPVPFMVKTCTQHASNDDPLASYNY